MSRAMKLPLAILLACLLGLLLALTPASSPPAQAQDPGTACWTGTWRHWPRWDPLYLAQNGNRVSGNYDYDKGRLSGTLDGDTLTGEWAEWPSYAPPDDAGHFVFTISPDCNSFDGLYNYGDDEDSWMGWGGERIDAPERVAVQVVKPTVTYREQEYPPGDTFFPNSCTEARGAGEGCEMALNALLEQQATEALISCIYAKLNKVMAVLAQAQLDPEEETLVMSIAAQVGFVKCVFGTTREPAELGLNLYQGVARITNLTVGQTISVSSPLATASSAGPGSFVAGYHPQTNEAIFTAYSAPLTVTPLSSAPLVLPPYHAVALTPEGFGPVRALLRLYVPVVVGP
ncbi:exported protein of unknown function [Candidatus Promineifilum breve]|uniref:Uncharacterized protein n=1 Tax=Candidatus Promineifilum breve TaxID=1806508 RepID=A0A160SZT4_9CHLR|nr:hypothetical protein [Candidatus Promineifilum breve]CUS02956.2 exported protein of unknown function [Candidatus Promineifilum breve]